MRLYRVSGQSAAERREWVGTQADAKARSKERGGFFDLVEVPTDKDGLIAYLNGMEAPAELSRDEILHSNTPEAQEAAKRLMQPESYAAKSLRFEDEFAAMPLATQLHYAALAMENAREKL